MGGRQNVGFVAMFSKKIINRSGMGGGSKGCSVISNFVLLLLLRTIESKHKGANRKVQFAVLNTLPQLQAITFPHKKLKPYSFNLILCFYVMVMFTPDLHCACTEHSFPSHSTLSTSGNRGISCRETKLMHNFKFIHIGRCG